MKVAVVIPNWNGADMIVECVTSLLAQSYKHTIVVVENGSTDSSVEILEENFPNVTLLKNKKNLGFAGGVNTGIRHALEEGFDAVALFNNDAVADKKWLENLVSTLDQNAKAGIVTCKFMSIDGSHLDSTGDIYTSWGLPYPRGRGEKVTDKYDQQTEVLGASGGASLYRSEMLRKIGLFDEDFFAYYEDVDISLRAQLAGWKVLYEPKAVAYHATGSTSSKIHGFATYQTIKNLPWVLWKNVPGRYLWRVLPRFYLAYLAFIISASFRGQATSVLKGVFVGYFLFPKKIMQRVRIQRSRTVKPSYIWSIMVHDLPPNATKLRKLRSLMGGK